MNQTLLLRTVNRIITSIEIGDKYAAEVLQHVLGCAGLACFAVHECHVLQVSEHPHVSILPVGSNLGLVRMHQFAGGNTIKNRPVGCLILTCFRGLHAINRPS